MTFSRPAAVAWLLLLLVAPVVTFATPLSMKDVIDLRRAKTDYADIVAKAKEQGIAFDIDVRAESRLRVMRFKPEHIAELKRIKDQQDNPTPPAGDAAPGDEKPAKPDDPLAKKALAEAPYGPRKSDGWQASTLSLIKAINHAANANVVMVEARAITLSAKQAIADRYIRDIQSLEAMLAKTFPDPIRTGTDKRSAHIVILETRYG